MSTLKKNTHIWRVIILILLLVAILGPWTYSPIQTPAGHDCDGSRIRLQEDLCGTPLSLRFIASRAVAGATPNILSGHAALPGLIPMPYNFLLYFLPFATTLLLFWRNDGAPLRALNAVGLGLVLLQGIVLFSRTPLRLHALPWGLLLYLVVACSALLVELRAFAKGIHFWRTAALTLLLIAMAGPWVYDLIHVPAQYSCDGPNVRLQGDFCGLPFPGFNVFFLLPLILFPVLTTLGLLRRDEDEDSRLRRIHRLAWPLAAIAAAAFILLQLPRPYAPPWGALLYVVVAVVATVVENLSAIRRHKVAVY